MRPITAALTAAQAVRSARARVAVTVHARGQNNQAPAVAWTEIVSNAGQVTWYAVAAVGLASGAVLRFRSTGTKIYQDTVANPTTAAGWAAASTVELRNHAAYSLAALRIPSSSTIRLFYINASDSKVYYLESTDNGATWSAPVTVYNTADAAADLCVAYIANGTVLNGPWFIGFSTYAGGNYTARFGYYNAAWLTHAYAVNWRAAGIAPYDPATTYHRVLVYRQHSYGQSRLRALHKAADVYSNPLDIDVTQAGLFGLQLRGYRLFQLPPSQTYLACAVEAAQGRGVHTGVAGYFYTADPTIDETVILPAIVATSSQPAHALCETLDTGAGDLYFVGDIGVYRGIRYTPTTATLTPIAYTYENHLVTLTLPVSEPAVAAGNLLHITRTISFGADTGSETLYALVVATETGRKQQTIIAADPLAYLGICRLRRPITLSEGTITLGPALRRLAARCGLPLTVDNAALDAAATIPTTIQPGESLRSAAYRLGSQATAYLVPAHNAFALEAITPGTSISGHHTGTPTAYPIGETNLIDAATLSDYRRLAFAYIFGSYSTDPEDGAALAMAAADPLPNTRPIAYALTNMRYNSYTRVEAAATTEAARQAALAVTARIEAPANLALELYDIVHLTDPTLGWSATPFRVRAWSEHYDRGRLTQTLWLGTP